MRILPPRRRETAARRALAGELRRQQVEIRDVGLTDNWKNYSPKVLVIFESTVIESPAP